MNPFAAFSMNLGVDLTSLFKGFDGAVNSARSYGQMAGEAWIQALSFSLVSFRGFDRFLHTINGQLRDMMSLSVEVFGMRAGANIAYYRRQLTGMIGDVTKANNVLSDLITIANTTAYDNSDIFGIAANALGSGTKDKDVTREVQSIVDAAAVSGVQDPTKFTRFARNMYDLKMKEGEANQRDVNEMTRAAPQILFHAAKIMGVDQTQARSKLFSMSGEEVYNLIKSIGEANRGKAKELAEMDPFQVARNIEQTFESAMAPTGELVNRIFVNLLGPVNNVIGAFARLNQSTHGVIGLLGAIGILVGLYRLYQFTILAVKKAMEDLAVSIAGLSTQTKTTTMANTASNSAANAAMWRKELLGLGGAAATGTAVATGTVAAEGLAAVIPYIGWIVAAAGLAFTGMSYLADFAKTREDETIGRGLTALYYGLIGSAISPGVGTIAGAVYGYNNWQAPAEELSDAAKDLKTAAQFLTESKVDGIGGGKQARSLLHLIDVQYSLIGSRLFGVS